MYREKIVIGEGSEYPLNGMLTIPDGKAGPFPAVVLVHGSGASNMDEKVIKLMPFRDLADGLAAHGIASIRYDKRTFVHGRKMMKANASGMTVREETIEDVLLALRLLRSDKRIDSNNIFLLGHSMGAMLAPRIDAEGGNAKGLIMMAGTPHRLEEIVLRQLRQSRSGNPMLGIVTGIEEKYFARKFRGLYDMSDEEARKKKFAGNVSLYYFKEMGRKTAADYLLESSKPALIMQGGRDFQVLADDDFKAFKELLAARDNITYKLYPELNHCFVPAVYDNILKASKEYGVERHIGEDVISDIAEFIHSCSA